MNNFYDQNAQTFFDGTIAVEMSSLYQKITPLLSKGASIIDAGCGSGRDSNYFSSLGYQVQAFDASEELVRLARSKFYISVEHTTFLDFTSKIGEVDAIWACASLLHVPTDELSKTFIHLSNFLKQKGVFYCSFKYGDEELERDGRRFTNLNESNLPKYLVGSQLGVHEQWITSDLRDGRENEKWLNAILIKR